MIRVIIGLLLVYGAVGGMDHQPEYFLEQSIAAVIGLIIMWFGVRKMNSHG